MITKTARSAMRLVLPAAFALGCAGAARAEVSAVSPETLVVTAAAADPILASTDVATIKRSDAQADGGATAYSSAPPSASSSGWQFTVTPYLWLTSLHGDLGVVRAIQPVSVDISPWYLIRHMHFGVMGAFEADKDRFVAVSDNVYAYVGITHHITIRDVDFATATVAPKMFITTNDVGYRMLDDPSLSIDILGGFRLYHVRPGISLTGPRRSFEGEQSHTWANPLVGLRFKGHLSDKLSWSVWGDVGATSPSDHNGQAFGSLQYAFARSWTAILGWRYLTTNYDNGQGFVFNVNLDGPLLGASFRF